MQYRGVFSKSTGVDEHGKHKFRGNLASTVGAVVKNFRLVLKTGCVLITILLSHPQRKRRGSGIKNKFVSFRSIKGSFRSLDCLHNKTMFLIYFIIIISVSANRS